MVKYDTKIKLDPHPSLKPGMSAIVDIILAEHKDVLTVPVAAIVEGANGFFCWVQNNDGVKKRAIRIGDTNDQFTVVLDGLNVGDAVILNPLAFVEEAQAIAIDPASEKDNAASTKKETSKETNKEASTTSANSGS